MKTREEYLQYCKDRAMAYLDNGQYIDAITSMMTDLNQHPSTALGEGSTSGILMILGSMAARNRDYAQLKRWIEGFN